MDRDERGDVRRGSTVESFVSKMYALNCPKIDGPPMLCHRAEGRGISVADGQKDELGLNFRIDCREDSLERGRPNINKLQ